MRRAVLVLVMLAAAVMLTAVLGEAHQRTGTEYVRYEGAGPGWDSTRVMVGGWPVPYLYDKPYLSPVGSVGLTAGLLGEDDFRAGPFMIDVALHFAGILAVVSAARRIMRARRG